MNISDLIGETTEYDKKEKLEANKPKSWCKSVSAFANGTGGMLIFGINDNDDVIGLKDAKAYSEKISEIIKARLDPIPVFDFGFEKIDDKKLLVLKVFPGAETPYYYYADGNRIAFVRVGNESVPADSQTLLRLVLRGTGRSYDSLPSRFNFKDLSFTKLRSVYKIKTAMDFLESDYVSFGLVGEDGKLTNAGALLADESPVRHSRVFCTRWNGLDKAPGLNDALDDREYSGSLISLLQNSEDFIKNNTKKPWRKTGHGRLEMPEYPEQAVLECLVNALIHRDYTEIGSEVHIDIFDDRMEIYSPGGMFDGTLVQNLDTDHVPSKRRNPVIADLFARMHYMERRGSGFKKIKADYLNATNFTEGKLPKFDSTGTSFFVTLYNLNYGDNESDIENDTENDTEVDMESLSRTYPELFLIKKNPEITTAQMASVLHIGIATVARHIKRLKELGVLERVGSDRKGYWKIIKNC